MTLQDTRLLFLKFIFILPCQLGKMLPLLISVNNDMNLHIDHSQEVPSILSVNWFVDIREEFLIPCFGQYLHFDF